MTKQVSGSTGPWSHFHEGRVAANPARHTHVSLLLVEGSVIELVCRERIPISPEIAATVKKSPTEHLSVK